MTWIGDAPTGVYKNAFLSMKIREQAAALAVFARFAEPEPGYGKQKGESVDIVQIHQLPLATRVAESVELPSGRPLVATKQLTVGEWGFKIQMSQLERHLTQYDIHNKFQRMLRDQMRLTMDSMCAEALRGTPIKVVGEGTVAVPVTTIDNVAAGVTLATKDAERNMLVHDLREIHDYMSGDLKIPPFSNGQYVGILSTFAARGIKNDQEYKDWQAPTTAQPFITGELPKQVEGFTLIETNHYDALANAVDVGKTGEAVFFGADSHFLAVVEDPEIRAGVATDLGRQREFGWVGTLEAGRTWDGTSYVTGPARVLHWTGSVLS